MRCLYLLLLQCGWVIPALHAQEDRPVTLRIGDPAPEWQVGDWLKGGPVNQLEKGNIYIIEFWATWCAPCRAAIPRLSGLARKYSGRVTVIGVDVNEPATTPQEKIQRFVDSMGHNMDYPVVREDSNFMTKNWLRATGELGIPGTIVVNAGGRVAWIGHPALLETVLPDIVNNNWDLDEARAKRKSDRELDSLDKEAYFELANYWGDIYKPGNMGMPNLMLWAIEEMVKKEPRLRYAPHVAYQTFTSLLKTNPQKAYEYGKMAMVTPTYRPPVFDVIVNALTTYSDKLTLPPFIYGLGAEACQLYIDFMPYPEISDIYTYYNKMAGWHYRAGDTRKAIAAQQKAIDELKHVQEAPSAALAAYESTLRRFKKRK